MLTNMSLNRHYTRITLNYGLTIIAGMSSRLGIRYENNSSSFELINSKQMVKNVCPSQKCHQIDLFLAFTYIQSFFLKKGI